MKKYKIQLNYKMRKLGVKIKILLQIKWKNKKFNKN